MADRPRRRVPTQRRSRETFERILDAAQTVLVQRGYSGASTTVIAELAGVSPGSLYQYFTDKDEIVAAVVSRFSESLGERVAATVAGSFDLEPREYLRTSMGALLDELDVHPGFVRVMAEQTPKLGADGWLAAFEQRIGELTVAYLTVHRAALRPDLDLTRASWMMLRTVEHLTVRFILDRPGISRDEFVDELVSMMMRYVSNA